MWIFKLGTNPVERFYRGGARIAAFRRTPVWPERAPEEWLASTTTVYGEPIRGLTMLDGKALRSMLEEHPEGFLGPAWQQYGGPEPGLLVKLLDAGERLPVHYHPNDEVARTLLHYPFGKTEAWFIMEAEPDSVVWLGFRAAIDPDGVGTLIERRDSERLLGVLRPIPVRPGDALFVPAGTPHAIGEGILMTELQQASDLSVLLEWWLVGDDAAVTWHLGLQLPTAVQLLDYTIWNDEVVAQNVRHIPDEPGRYRLFPEAADTYFRAERIVTTESEQLEASYQVLIVLSGHGLLQPDSDEATAIEAGDVLLVGYGAGALRVSGNVDILRCLPGMPR